MRAAPPAAGFAAGTASTAAPAAAVETARSLVQALLEPTVRAAAARAARGAVLKFGKRSASRKELLAASCLEALGLGGALAPTAHRAPPPLPTLVVLLVDVEFCRNMLLVAPGPARLAVLDAALSACEGALSVFAASLLGEEGAAAAPTRTAARSADADAALEILASVLQRIAPRERTHRALPPIDRACRGILRTRGLDKVMHTQAAIVCVLLAHKSGATRLVLRAGAAASEAPPLPFADSLPLIPRLALYRAVLAAARRAEGDGSAAFLAPLFDRITDAVFVASPRTSVRWSALVTLHAWVTKAVQSLRWIKGATVRASILATAQRATDATLAAWGSREKKIASLCAPLFRSVVKLHSAASASSSNGAAAGAGASSSSSSAEEADASWEQTLVTRLLALPSIDRAKSLALNVLLKSSSLTAPQLVARDSMLVPSLLHSISASTSVASPAAALVGSIVALLVKSDAASAAEAAAVSTLLSEWLALLASQLASCDAPRRRPVARYSLPAVLEATVAGKCNAQATLLRLLSEKLTDATDMSSRSALRWAALCVARWKPKRPLSSRKEAAKKRKKKKKNAETETVTEMEMETEANCDDALHAMLLGSMLDGEEEVRAAAYAWACEGGNKDRLLAVSVRDASRLPSIRKFMCAGGAMSQTPEFRQVYARSSSILFGQLQRHNRAHLHASISGEAVSALDLDDAAARAEFLAWFANWLVSQLRSGCSRWRVVVALDLWTACQRTWSAQSSSDVEATRGGLESLAALSHHSSTRMLLQQLLTTTWEADRKQSFALLLAVDASDIMHAFDESSSGGDDTPGLIAAALSALASKRATACDAGAMLLVLLLRTTSTRGRRASGDSSSSSSRDSGTRFHEWLRRDAQAKHASEDDAARLIVEFLLDRIDRARHTSFSGIHGFALAIRRVIEDNSIAVGDNSAAAPGHSVWCATAARAHSIAFAVMDAAVAALREDEGSGRAAGDDSTNVQHWLCLKECAGLITAMTLRNRMRSGSSSSSSEGAEPLLSVEQLQVSGARLLDFLLSTKHSGALASIAQCLETVSSALLSPRKKTVSTASAIVKETASSLDAAAEEVPLSWMRHLLNHASFSDPQFVVRRGAGFADGFLALLRSENSITSARRPMLVELFKHLLRRSRGNGDETGGSSQTCALFVLRHVLADRTLEQHAAHESAKKSALFVVLRLLSQSGGEEDGGGALDWNVQNAAQQLFAVLLESVLKGNAKESDKALPFSTFIAMNPRAAGLIMEIFTAHRDGKRCGCAAEGLYASLILLSRMGPGVAAETSILTPSRRGLHCHAEVPLVVCLASAITCSSNDMRIRQMAARVAAALVPLNAVTPLLATLRERVRAQLDGTAGSCANALHGTLLQLVQIARKLQRHTSATKAWSFYVNAGFEELSSELSQDLAAIAHSPKEAADVRQQALTVLDETRELAVLARAFASSVEHHHDPLVILKQLVHESALCINAEQNVKNAELRRGSSERWSNPRSEISRNAFVNFSSSLHMRSMILADVAHPPVEFRDLIAGDDAGAAAAGDGDDCVMRSAAYAEIVRAALDQRNVVVHWSMWSSQRGSIRAGLLEASKTKHRGGAEARMLRRCTRAWVALTLRLHAAESYSEMDDEGELESLWRHLADAWGYHGGSRTRCCFIEAAGCIIGLWAARIAADDAAAAARTRSPPRSDDRSLFLAAAKGWGEWLAVASDPLCADELRAACVASFSHCARLLRDANDVVEWWAWDAFLILLHDEDVDVRGGAASVASENFNPRFFSRSDWVGDRAVVVVAPDAALHEASLPFDVETELWRVLQHQRSGVAALLRLASREVAAHSAIVAAACGPMGWISTSSGASNKDDEEAFPLEPPNEWKESITIAQRLGVVMVGGEDNNIVRGAAASALALLAPHSAALERLSACGWRWSLLLESAECLRYYARSPK